MSLEQNKAVVQRFVEEVQCRHNLAVVDELFGPTIVDHTGMVDPPNREGARKLFAMMFAAFPDLHVTIRQQIAEGDKVVSYKTFRGTHGGPFMGIPATGKAVSFDVIDILTVQDGQFTEHWMVGDMLGLMQQLTAVPAP
jgi:predicted ester cyclase